MSGPAGTVTQGSVWPGPRLLLPITVDALVLGTPNMNGQTFSNLQIPYSSLSLSPSVAPAPFAKTSTKQLPLVGINLLWTLPFGMRSGQTQDDGCVVFPLLPNRWVILRSYLASATAAPQLTAFVLESDYLGANSQQGTSAYPNPYPTPGKPLVWIGRRFDLGSWTGTDQTPAPFLRAVGPGNVAFTAAYQNVQNVFALYDQASSLAVGTYTYMVSGWYSPIPASPAGFTWWSDPLLDVNPSLPAGFTTEAEWSALLAAFRCQVGDGSAGALGDAQSAWQAWQALHPTPGSFTGPQAQLDFASQTLCHGCVFGIDWQGPDQLYKQAMSGLTISTAIGNNPTEALGAWLGSVLPPPGQGAQPVERLVEAFQSGQIQQLTEDPVAFETQRHDAEFSSGSGGTLWRVLAPQQGNPSLGEGAGNQSVDLDSTATGYLTQLNSLQATLDGQTNVLASQQYQLYSLWYLDQTDPNPQIDQGISQLEQAIAQQQAALALGRTNVAGAQATLVGYLASLPPPQNSWEVQPVKNLPYESPNDPVVLIAGSNFDDKLSAPGTFDDGSTNLVTRFTGQTVTALEAITSGSFSANITAAMVAQGAPLPVPPGPVLFPPEVNDLWLETLLLDPSAAGFLANLYFKSLGITPSQQQLTAVTQEIQTVQGTPWNSGLDSSLDPLALAAAAQIQGVPPEQLSFLQWAQPWTPLTIDWQVQFFPSNPTPASPLTGWTLDEIDYEWNGGQVGGQPLMLSGSTILSAQTALGLQSQINQFINTSPEYAQLPVYQQKELREIVATMGQWDVITQPLGDLGNMLLMRAPTIAGIISDSAVQSGVGSVSLYAPLPQNQFTPVRAGHLLINRIWVVDVFGQRITAAPDGQNVVPVIAEPMVTPGGGQPAYIQLPPRLTQPARVDLALLQADADTIRSNSSDATSPVCGYIAPNYLDGSLTVFDAGGMNQGAVQPIVLDSGAGVRWDAAAGSSAPLGSPPDLLNQHLSSMTNALLQLGLQGVGALDELLGLMDGTQWLADPLGQQEQGNLDALVGRPLAVVRAQVALEPDGLPAYNQSFAAAEAYAGSGGETDGFTKVNFQLRIGDLGFTQNGVVGFYLDDDYTRLYAVYGYEPVTQGLRRSLAGRGNLRAGLQTLAAATPQSGSSNYLILNGLIPLSLSTPPRMLTLLVSPRGEIPAISGSLPVVRLTLAPGPTTAAFANMDFTFRTGPLLTNPIQLRMPLPADIRGSWAWVQRDGVTNWKTDDSIKPEDALARLPSNPTRLDEGWLQLSGAEVRPKPKPKPPA